MHGLRALGPTHLSTAPYRSNRLGGPVQASETDFLHRYPRSAFLGAMCSAPRQDARLTKNRVQKLDAHLAIARRFKHCNGAGKRRKGAGCCLVAVRGRCGAIDGRNGRLVTENQPFIGRHSVCVVAHGAIWRLETGRMHKSNCILQANTTSQFSGSHCTIRAAVVAPLRIVQAPTSLESTCEMSARTRMHDESGEAQTAPTPSWIDLTPYVRKIAAVLAVRSPRLHATIPHAGPDLP